MVLYMIRHGETDWNKVRRLQGRSDIPLNSEGIRLAKVTSDALKSVPFTRIYTSPLKRARQTAEIIKGERNIPVIEEPRIQEISFGIYEGYHCGKDNYDIPDPDFINFFDNPEKYIPPKNAESIAELCKRTTDFLQELVYNKEYENDVILLSTHGAALRGLLSSVTGRGVDEFWKGGVHKNCAVTIVEAIDGKLVMREEGKVYYDN